MSEDEDDYKDDGFDVTVNFAEKNSTSKEEIKTRIDQYLTTSKLGRMAFVAGDVQLAKDRFNLAMTLEMQTELENNTDFGVTGGLLREEMSSRAGGKDSESDDFDRFGGILSRLLQVFEHADGMVAKNPKDAKWYIIMGSCLCMVNEWEKAEVVYKEGMKACPGNKDIQKSLQSLRKLTETTSHLISKTGSNSIWNGNDDNYSTGTSNFIDGGRHSLPTEPKLRPVNVIEKKRHGSLPATTATDAQLNSCSATKMRLGSISKISQETRQLRSKSLMVMNNGKLSPKSAKRFSVSQQWNEHAVWKSSFSPVIQSVKLEEGFSSRTMRTMRDIEHSSDIEIKDI